MKKKILFLSGSRADYDLILPIHKFINSKKKFQSKLLISGSNLDKKYSNHKKKISNSFNYWGSCNTAGIIHLNWRLIFAPTKILKYIIVHELCHLKEFNHTKNFWMLVKRFCPDYKNQILWLKQNDSYLYSIRFD